MPERKQFMRSRRDRIIGGVGGGLAEYLGIDPTLVRALLVAALFFNWVTGLLYLVLCALLPEEDSSPSA